MSISLLPLVSMDVPKFLSFIITVLRLICFQFVNMKQYE